MWLSRISTAAAAAAAERVFVLLSVPCDVVLVQLQQHLLMTHWIHRGRRRWNVVAVLLDSQSATIWNAWCLETFTYIHNPVNLTVLTWPYKSIWDNKLINHTQFMPCHRFRRTRHGFHPGRRIEYWSRWSYAHPTLHTIFFSYEANLKQVIGVRCLAAPWYMMHHPSYFLICKQSTRREQDVRRTSKRSQ